MKVNIPDAVIEKWQTIVDLASDILHIPAGLITRINGSDIEVYISSNSPGNPYVAGLKGPLGSSGWYCEATINSRDKNFIPNALKDARWQENPALAVGIISYLGYPIFLPDGEVFGTICVLDTKELIYSETHAHLIVKFKELIESHLEILQKQLLLQRALEQIHTLEKFLPICSYCKKIRDDANHWHPLEKYISDRTQAKFSHGICPECSKKMDNELEELN